MRAFVVGGAVLALATAATPAVAQTELGITAGFYSGYVWRGLTLVNKPVLQPDINLSFPLGAASLTIGGWGNVELGSYDGDEDISQGGGSSFNLSEFDPYAEIGFTFGKAEVAFGGVGYIYPNEDPGVTSDFNTWEVYAKAGLDAPLAPTIAAYYDIDKIKGLYIEGSLSHDIPLGPKALTIGALAGWNISQGPNEDDPDEGVNFADKGITHVDLSASIEFGAGPFSITPSVHGVFALDDATKVTKFEDGVPNSKDFKIWGGISISWGKAFGKVAEE